jgi:hypothetical protein
MEAYMSRRADDGTQDFDEAKFPGLSDEIESKPAENIRLWRTYLPDDCITTMINMGWDQST